MPDENIFLIRLSSRYLVYAPLHNLAALVDWAAACRLRDYLDGEKVALTPQLTELAAILSAPGDPAPSPKNGDFAPDFLGLLPTRACNFACRYCNFLDAETAGRSMSPALVRDSIEWYFDLLQRRGQASARIDFFGGEAFCAPETLDLAVILAEKRATETGLKVQFEAATNGAFSEERARWAADHIHTIVLSFDGPPEIQDRQRPYAGGQPSSAVVSRSATLLAGGMAELNFRSCVTLQTVERLPEIAEWFCQNFRPNGVCFEPVLPGEASIASGLEPPDPWAFATQFGRAARVLERYGVEPVYITAELSARRVSFCPVARDVAIVAPDGSINACYLLEKDWKLQGMDLRLGRMTPSGADLDWSAVESARRLNVTEKAACQRCFCRWHCAGGCHVHHRLPPAPGSYDRLCHQTRAITVRNILRALGRDELAAEWADSPTAMQESLLSRSDRLSDLEER